jgi:hypothetical protein
MDSAQLVLPLADCLKLFLQGSSLFVVELCGLNILSAAGQSLCGECRA